MHLEFIIYKVKAFIINESLKTLHKCKEYLGNDLVKLEIKIFPKQRERRK